MPALARAAIVPVLLVLCVACKGDLRSGPRVAVSPTAAHSRPDPSEAVLSSESDLSDHGTHRGLRHLSAEAAEGERVSDKLTQLLKRSPLLKQHSESVGRNTRKEKTTDNATDPDKGLASIRGHKLTREQMFELLDGDDPAEFPSFKQRVGRIFSFVDPSGEAGGNGQHRTSPFVDEHSFTCQPTMAGRSSEMQIHVGHTTYTADTYLRWNEDATRHIFSVLEHHQFPTDGCTARKWLVAVPPTQAGLLSDFHTLQVGMLIAARLGRTFVLEGEVQRRKLDVAEAGKPGSEYYHMGMYISGMGSCYETINRTVAGVQLPGRIMRMRRVGGVHSIDGAHEVPIKQLEALDYIMAYKAPMLKLTEVTVRHTGPLVHWLADNFEVADWQHMVKHSMVWLDGPDGEIKDPQRILEETTPFHKTMMLRSVTARWLFYPRRDLLKGADDVIPPNLPRPMAFVQIRMTDKGNEDPFYRKYKRYHKVDDYLDALSRKEKSSGESWGSIFFMSDSLHALKEALESSKTRFPNAKLLSSEPPAELEANHTKSAKLLYTTGHTNLPAGVKRTSFQRFLAAIIAGVRQADYTVMTLNSNVGRFILELLASIKCTSQVVYDGMLGFSVDETHWITNP